MSALMRSWAWVDSRLRSLVSMSVVLAEIYASFGGVLIRIASSSFATKNNRLRIRLPVETT